MFTSDARSIGSVPLYLSFILTSQNPGLYQTCYHHKKRFSKCGDDVTARILFARVVGSKSATIIQWYSSGPTELLSSSQSQDEKSEQHRKSNTRKRNYKWRSHECLELLAAFGKARPNAFYRKGEQPFPNDRVNKTSTITMATIHNKESYAG
jgi:hypothetical protein